MTARHRGACRPSGRALLRSSVPQMSRVVVVLLLFVVFVAAHNILYKTRLVCGPEGPPTKIEWMLFNDYGPKANLTSIGVSGGYIPGTTITFGPTVNCNSPTCNTYTSTLPAWDYTGPYRSSFVLVQVDLVANPTYASCKQAGNTNCGNPYQSVTLKGKAYWPQDDHLINPWGPRTVAITEAMVSGANCPTDLFNCPNPVTDECSVAACRCNSFKFTKVKTVNGQTTISVNVTNNCPDAFYYAAFGLNDGLSLVSPANGATYQGTNYQWTVQQVDGTSGSTTPAIPWVRFVTKAGTNGDTQFTNQTGKGPAWDVFTFVVSGYQSDHAWTVQGHEGGKWDTFTNIDVSLCPCPDCDSTTSDCPTKPGYTGQNCTECDRSPPPGDYTWFCLDNQNPSIPFRLVKIPISTVGQAPYVAPGFVPTYPNGSLHVVDGYVINCDCTREIHDCQELDYCNGHGTCDPRTGDCQCLATYIGPDCLPPTTIPATTSPVTTTPASTSTTNVAPTTTVPSLPCYNNGLFCSGHGTCTNGICVCISTYNGNACENEIPIATTTRYCDEFTSCDTCRTQATGLGLDCAWCRDLAGGGCIATGSCLNAVDSCGATGVSFVPEPCPDDCSGSHGSCVNITCSQYAKQGKKPPTLNGQLLCINDSASFQVDETQNETIYVDQNYTSFCVCKKGYSGKNCGSKSSGLAKALAISGGVIAAIVICGVIVVVIIAFGAKKGVDFVLLHHQAASDFKINPTHENRDQEHFSGIHQ